MEHNSQLKIFCVVVTYNSDIPQLTITLKSVPLGITVIVADNSDDLQKRNAIQELSLHNKTQYIGMNGNHGIAAAQNKAARQAIGKGANYILLLDDDSTMSIKMLHSLLEARTLLSRKGIDTDSVILSPQIADRYGACLNAQTQGIFQCREMTSSGSLIPSLLFQKVGFFDESLFIDCVDYEWGWRAQLHGCQIYAVKNALLYHKLGEGRLRSLHLGIPSPLRHYYQYRNILNMMSRSYTPLRWKAAQLLKLPVKLLLISLFCAPRRTRLYFALQGIRDFFKGKTGKYEN